MLGGLLDWMILKVSSTLDDSMLLIFKPFFLKKIPVLGILACFGVLLVFLCLFGFLSGINGTYLHLLTLQPI